MSTESIRVTADPTAAPTAPQPAARRGKQAVARARVQVRHVRARAPQSNAYSSFERGGVRRFERPAPPRFRIS